MYSMHDHTRTCRARGAIAPLSALVERSRGTTAGPNCRVPPVGLPRERSDGLARPYCRRRASFRHNIHTGAIVLDTAKIGCISAFPHSATGWGRPLATARGHPRCRHSVERRPGRTPWAAPRALGRSRAAILPPGRVLDIMPCSWGDRDVSSGAAGASAGARDSAEARA
jgi:hypothetical protein